MTALSVKHGLLGVLAQGPRHGYDLKSEFDVLTGGLWELNIGQVYSTLERMKGEGLIALTPDVGEGDERKVYQITPEGERELALWLKRPPLKPRPLRDELLIRLGLLLGRDPAAALALLDAQRLLYHVQMADLTRQKLALTGPPGSDRLRRELLLDGAILHAEADLRWLDSCETKVQKLLGR